MNNSSCHGACTSFSIKIPAAGSSGGRVSAFRTNSPMYIINDYRKILNIKTSTNPTAHAMVEVME